MSLFTSDSFASASAAGTDWRDTAKKVLEDLEKSRTAGDNFNIGFLYISDKLTEDARSILSLFRSVTRIDHWVGAIGLGVCGTGMEYVDEPAIAVMIGRIDSQNFCIFPSIDLNPGPAKAVLEQWTDANEPMLVLVHGDPLSDSDPAAILAQLDQITGGFLAGGMSSSRTAHLQFADEVMQGGISGVAFSQDVPVASGLTQGCAPLGPMHTITRCEEHIVMELDGQRAFDVFAADLRAMAAQKAGLDPERAIIAPAAGEDPGDLFRGEVHVAFPVSGTDRQDYLVRNALGIDPEKGWIAVAHNVMNGEQMMFVHRDNETVRADLSRMLLDLRERLKRDGGAFAPRGALYISCVARTMSDFGDGHGGARTGEMKLVREVIGDVPLAGFYANGEISNRRIYGYTAVLILFL